MIPVVDEIMAPEAPTVKCVQPGTIIVAARGLGKEEDGKTFSWTVEAIYAHVVLARAGSRRRCFCYGDLVTMGLEYQEPTLEAMRII